MSASATTTNTRVPPVYFISHGGPPIIEWTHHPAYSAFERFGKEVLALKPRGLVVVSAHFTGGSDEIYINDSESTELIYDFYGFPKSYYNKTFNNTGSQTLAVEISKFLSSANIKSRFVKRGLDHGVWIPFSIAFDPVRERALEIPIVQLSLYASEDPTRHIALGKALAPLRDAGYVIIASGQAVHNLRDLSFTETKPRSYVKTFDRALETAMTTGTGDERESEMLVLLKRTDARNSHPTFEHLMPIYVALGAASHARGKKIFNHQEGSLSWAQFRLDDV